MSYNVVVRYGFTNKEDAVKFMHHARESNPRLKYQLEEVQRMNIIKQYDPETNTTEVYLSFGSMFPLLLLELYIT